jgi:hypothetical protein
MVKISAERKPNGDKKGGSIEVDYDIPDTLNDMVQRYGENVVYNHARGSVIVALQGYLRSQLGKDKPASPADIQKEVRTWKPGVRKQGKSPAEKAREQLAKLTPEERAALLKEHRAMAQAHQAKQAGAPA